MQHIEDAMQRQAHGDLSERRKAGLTHLQRSKVDVAGVRHQHRPCEPHLKLLCTLKLE